MLLQQQVHANSLIWLQRNARSGHWINQHTEQHESSDFRE